MGGFVHPERPRSSAQEEIDDHQYGEQNQAGDEAADDEFLLDRQEGFGRLMLDFFAKIGIRHFGLLRAVGRKQRLRRKKRVFNLQAVV